MIGGQGYQAVLDAGLRLRQLQDSGAPEIVPEECLEFGQGVLHKELQESSLGTVDIIWI